MSDASQLTGIFGAPLALVEQIIGACPSYLAVRSTGEVFLYERAPQDLENGDVWIEIGYDDGSAGGQRTSLDADLSGFSWDRRIVLSLVWAANFADEESKRQLVNLTSAIAREMLQADTTRAIQSLRLDGFFFDTKTDPKLIGARMHLGI